MAPKITIMATKDGRRVPHLCNHEDDRAGPKGLVFPRLETQRRQQAARVRW